MCTISPNKTHGLPYYCLHEQAKFYRLYRFWKMSTQIWATFRSKNDSIYLDVKLKVSRKDDNKELRLAKNLTMRDSEFNQFMQLRIQLVIAAQNFRGEQNLSPKQIKLLFKDLSKQLKLAHRVVEFVDRPNKKICVTKMRCNVNKPERSYAQVRLFARNRWKNFQQ